MLALPPNRRLVEPIERVIIRIGSEASESLEDSTSILVTGLGCFGQLPTELLEMLVRHAGSVSDAICNEVCSPSDGPESDKWRLVDPAL